MEDARYTSEDRQRGAVAPIVGGEEVYQKLGVAVHNGAYETSLADEIGGAGLGGLRARRRDTELLGVNAEAIGRLMNEPAILSSCARRLQRLRFRRSTRGPTRRSTASIDYGIVRPVDSDLQHDASPSAVETALEALQWCGRRLGPV